MPILKIMFAYASMLIYKKEDNEILILAGKRVNKPGKNKIFLPSGHYEKSDKTLLNCAIRESYEELNLNLKNSKIKSLFKLSLPFFRFQAFYTLYPNDAQVKVDEKEFFDINFFNAKSLPKESHFFFRFLVKRFLKRAKNLFS